MRFVITNISKDNLINELKDNKDKYNAVYIDEYDKKDEILNFIPSKLSEDKKEKISEKFGFLLVDEEVVNGKKIMSTNYIHCLRTFAESIYNLLFFNKRIDILNKENDRKITFDEFLKLLNQTKSNEICYSGFVLENLTDVNIYNGYYLPVFKKLDEHFGSSFYLFEELEALYDTGAVKYLERYIYEFGRNTQLYEFCQNLLYIWKRLMYCSIESIVKGNVISLKVIF